MKEYLKFFKKLKQRNALEDRTDQFNHSITPAVFITFIGILFAREVIFLPIECWIPKEWHSSWEEFTENLCWIEHTYQMNMSVAASKQGSIRINYYQWVHFVLVAQCLCFYLPHVLWENILTQFGHFNFPLFQHVKQKIQMTDRIPDRSLLVDKLAQEIYFPTLIRSRNKPGGPSKFSKWMFVFYLLVKLVYLSNCILQLWIMKTFINFESNHTSRQSSQISSWFFGWILLKALVQGRDWQQTGWFPRVTWCDIRRRGIGDTLIDRSVMCVLPMNMLNEKIYILLWFWVAACLLMIIGNIVWWCVLGVRWRKNRRFYECPEFSSIEQEIAMSLGVSNSFLKPAIDEHETEKWREFCWRLYSSDAMFVISMIRLNCGRKLTSDVVQRLWSYDKKTCKT